MNMENLKPGDYFTVTRGQSLTSTGHDRSWNGALLKAIAIDLPFVVFEETRSDHGLPGNTRRSLNLSSVRWKIVSADFAKAMLNEHP